MPIIYGPKEKWFTRDNSDPDLDRPIDRILPRMSYQMSNIQHDKDRQLNKMTRNHSVSGSTTLSSQFIGVPYNLDFVLSIEARNIDQGNQIIEQILPYFASDYTVTINVIPSIGRKLDIPIIMNSTNQQIEYEGDQDSIRSVEWTLTFTMKVMFYGPVTQSGLIRKVIANIYNDPALMTGYIVRANMTAGNNGDYVLDEFAYQGETENTATALGTVIRWDSSTGKLTLGGTQGSFQTNTAVKTTASNANYILHSFEATPMKLATIVIDPDPINALPNSDYGYVTTISEFPETS